MRIACTLFERVKRHEDRAGIGRVGESRAGEADDIDAMGHAGHAKRDVERALLHGVGARERRRRRKLNDDNEVSAVDLRNEPDRRLPESVEAETDDDEIEHEHDRGAAYGAPGKPGDAGADMIEHPIEAAKETV